MNARPPAVSVAVDVEGVRSACARLAEAGPMLVQRPWAELAESLGTVGARFADPADPLRIEALERLPAEAELSAEMARVVLDGMARDWTVERLRRTVRAEFEDPDCLDGIRRVRGRDLMAVGASLCVQIVSGSVPGVGVNALVRSLLVKAPTLVKPGRGDVVLTELFGRGLADADPGLAAGLAVAYWPGGAGAELAAALEEADLVVTYGSDETVAAVRALARPTARFVGYHHRLGLALVGRAALGSKSVDGTARSLARAVALFEQRGCVCPHLVFVESGGELDGEAFSERLAHALEVLEAELPSAPVHATEGAALQQLRGTAELHAAAGGGSVRHGGAEAPWTVFHERVELPSGPPTLARGVRVRSIPDAMELPAVLRPMGPHLQSVAVAGLADRLPRVVEALGRAGASRIVPIERVSFPPPWWLHDGQGPLRELVRWVETEV